MLVEAIGSTAAADSFFFGLAALSQLSLSSIPGPSSIIGPELAVGHFGVFSASRARTPGQVL